MVQLAAVAGPEVLCKLEASLRTEVDSSALELLQRLPLQDLTAVVLHLLDSNTARESFFDAALGFRPTDLGFISEESDWADESDVCCTVSGVWCLVGRVCVCVCVCVCVTHRSDCSYVPLFYQL